MASSNPFVFVDNIKYPLTIHQIVEQYQSGEYNAEMLLQHLFIKYYELQKAFFEVEKSKQALKEMQEYIEIAKKISVGSY